MQHQAKAALLVTSNFFSISQDGLASLTEALRRVSAGMELRFGMGVLRTAVSSVD